MDSNRPILIVEDDRVDAMTIKRAMKEIKLVNEIVWAENGEEGLTYLKSNKALPCIIILDLNMPKMNGHEFIEIVKKDKNINHIPIIVLTTSRAEQDKLKSFQSGVAGYMVKPIDYLQFVEVIRTIKVYWTLSELPSE